MTIESILDQWLRNEQVQKEEQYLSKIQQKFKHYPHSIYVLNNNAQKIQVAYRRYKFRKFQSKIEKRALKITASQDKQGFLLFTPDHSLPQLDLKSKSYYQSRNRYEEVNAPALSERKKSVSFCDQLEEVYYVESFKTDRAKSAEKRRFNFERSFITPLQIKSKPATQSSTQDTDSPMKVILTTDDKHKFAMPLQMQCKPSDIHEFSTRKGSIELPIIQEINRSVILENQHLKKLQKKYVPLTNNGSLTLRGKDASETTTSIAKVFTLSTKNDTIQSKTFLKSFKDKAPLNIIGRGSPRQVKPLPQNISSRKSPTRQSPVPQLRIPQSSQVVTKEAAERETKASFLKKTHTSQILKLSASQQNFNVTDRSFDKGDLKTQLMKKDFFKNYQSNTSLLNSSALNTSKAEEIRQTQAATARSRNSPLKESSSQRYSTTQTTIQSSRPFNRYGSVQKLNTTMQQARPSSRQQMELNSSNRVVTRGPLVLTQRSPPRNQWQI